LTPEAFRRPAAKALPALDLVDCYRVVLRSVPSGHAVVTALLQRLEIENLKQAWRGLAAGHPVARWSRGWQSLAPLATLDLDRCRDCRSLDDLVTALAATPYHGVSTAMLRAHRGDTLAAELGFDRWASRRLLDAALALTAHDAAGRDLACRVVGERDLQLLARGVGAFGLAPDAVLNALVFLPRVVTRGALSRLATWTPDEGPLPSLWPRPWQRVVGRAQDWDTLIRQWRRARYQACRRAFLDDPFCVAPAIALLLLAEEERRGTAALAAAAADPSSAAALDDALAAGALGA
jgi:hypothetical protein